MGHDCKIYFNITIVVLGEVGWGARGGWGTGGGGRCEINATYDIIGIFPQFNTMEYGGSCKTINADLYAGQYSYTIR